MIQPPFLRHIAQVDHRPAPVTPDRHLVRAFVQRLLRDDLIQRGPVVGLRALVLQPDSSSDTRGKEKSSQRDN